MCGGGWKGGKAEGGLSLLQTYWILTTMSLRMSVYIYEKYKK
jgi:hypothetical protein